MPSHAVTAGMPSSPGALHLSQDDVIIRKADVSGLRQASRVMAADRWVSGSFHGKSSPNAIPVSVTVSMLVSDPMA